MTFTLLDLRARQDDAHLFCRMSSAWLDTIRACAGVSDKGGVASARRSLRRSTCKFKDDLRASNFAYILEESGKINILPYGSGEACCCCCCCCGCCGISESTRLPEAGEILFHSGSGQQMPAMTWRYCEPRAVTKLQTCPSPPCPQTSPFPEYGGCVSLMWSGSMRTLLNWRLCLAGES